MDDILAEYTSVEILDEYICRKCSLDKTLERLTLRFNNLTDPTIPISISQKKTLPNLRKQILKIKSALTEEPERDLGEIKLDKFFQSAMKQMMFARPSETLVIHLNRSHHFANGYAVKNTCKIIFPELLDLNPYSTNSQLKIQPDGPISFMTENTQGGPGIFYRLNAVIVHYGAHSYGRK